MTKDQFNNKIGFKQIKTPDGYMSLIGSIELVAKLVIAEQYANDNEVIEDAKLRIKEELWRLIYEDRRKFFMDKITEARRCAFWDFKDFDEKMRELSVMALEGL